MRELPRANISEDFYMWFDLEEKKEHYATPLYLYQVKRDRINPSDETKLYLKLKKDISKVKTGKDKEIIRHPSTIYIHYVESLGAMLINFLNADFTNYETAYNTFFYAYGYELVKDYAPYSYLKNDEHITDVQFKEIIKDIFETGSDRFIEWQDNFRKCVDFVYNLNGNEELKESKPSSKFIASLVTHHNDVYSYSNDIEVILDTYSDKYLKYGNQSLENLTIELDKNDSFIPMTNVYTSEKLSNIVFVVLEQFVKNSNLPIKSCQYCGRYFVPSVRQDELYCDLPSEDGKSCREKGAKQTYKKNLEKIPALLEY